LAREAGTDDTITDLLQADLLGLAQAALVVADPKGTITGWNPHAELLFGSTADQALGSDLRSILSRCPDADLLLQAHTEASLGITSEMDTRLEMNGSLFVHLSQAPLRASDGSILGTVLVCFDISERRYSEIRLAVNYQVTRVLAEATDLFTASRPILEAISRAVESSFAAVWAIDQLAEEARCIDVWHDGTPETAGFAAVVRWHSFKKGVGVPGRIWTEGAPTWIPNVAEDVNFPLREAAEKAGLRSAFGFPILLRGEVLGVLNFYSPEIREPDDNILDLVASIGSQLGQFIDRTQAEEAGRINEARRDAILRSALDCIVTMDHLGRIVEFNPAAEDVFGYRREDVVGKELAGVLIPPHLRDRHRQGVLHYLESGQGAVIGRRTEITGMRSDGSEFPLELTVTRIDVPGPPAFSGYIRDITERKESERERMRLLEAEQSARADAELASKRLQRLQTIMDAALSHLSVDEMLDTLLKRITDTLDSDAAALLLTREGSKDVTLRAARGLNTSISSIAPIPHGSQAVGIVAAERRSLIVEDLENSDIEAPLMQSEGMRSLMVVPLVVENHVIGVLESGSRSPHRFTEDDLQLLRLAADRIASPIQNAALYEREHRIAKTLQQSLLPSKIPEVDGITVVERYVPGGQGLDVGGDWYDVLVLPDGRVGAVIGDVVGKGVGAAALMGQLRNALRAFAMEGRDPADVMTRINRLTDSLDRETMAATLIYLVLDPADGSVVLSSAGHPPPLLAVSGTGLEFVSVETNIPLGVTADYEYQAASMNMPPGARLILYTDGLIEEPGTDVDAGLARLRAVAARGPQDPGEFCDYLLREVFRERERYDDVALLVLRRDR
jgi:PAS domain S-box-containing protein